jgi:hypothetical protein
MNQIDVTNKWNNNSRSNPKCKYGGDSDFPLGIMSYTQLGCGVYFGGSRHDF